MNPYAPHPGSGEFVPSSRLTSEAPHITLVVNPDAGRGHAGRVLPKVSSALLTQIPEAHLTVYQTNSYSEARYRTQAAVEHSQPSSNGSRGDALVVMGGDGMAHLGLNACAESNVTLGIIPAGTGNDFCRGVGVPQNVAAATRAIINGERRTIDLNRVSGAIAADQTRFVGSVVSTGYDAKVNRRTNEITTPWGPLAYAYVALRELATFEPMRYRIDIDGHRRELEAMFVAVGNAGYFGGGMLVCPPYDVTDGELDITLVHPVPRGKLLRLLPSMFSGKFVTDDSVELIRARRIDVDGDAMFSMADGEELGGVPLTVEVAPKALTLYVP